MVIRGVKRAPAIKSATVSWRTGSHNAFKPLIDGRTTESKRRTVSVAIKQELTGGMKI